MTNNHHTPENKPKGTNPEHVYGMSNRAKKFGAAICLALVMAGVGIAEKKEIGQFFGDIFYSSVNDNEGPKVHNAGNGHLDNLTPPDSVKITEEKLSDGEVFVLVDGAVLRTSPVFGDGETRTALAILDEPVILFDVNDYEVCIYQNGDTFYGFSDNKVEKAIPNVKNEENGDGRTWVNKGEVNIIENPES